MIKNTIQELENAEITAVAGGIGYAPPPPRINDNPLFSKVIVVN